MLLFHQTFTKQTSVLLLSFMSKSSLNRSFFSPLVFGNSLRYERFLSGGRHRVRWQPLFINIFSAWWRIDFTLQMINWVPMFCKSMLAWTHTRWQRLFFLRHRETITQHFCRVCQVYSSSQRQYYSSCKWSVVSSDYSLDYTLENTEASDFVFGSGFVDLWVQEQILKRRRNFSFKSVPMQTKCTYGLKHQPCVPVKTLALSTSSSIPSIETRPFNKCSRFVLLWTRHY